MVKGVSMLISEFAGRAGMTTDTVRYYVRLGLLRPETGAKGGGNPYQVFTMEHLLAARIIRTAQSLGLSLKEVADISTERRSRGMTTDRSVEILQAQLDRLEVKASEVIAMKTYLIAKIDWLKSGGKGTQPDFPEVRD
ncbi:MAG TPA: MerR family transcriptional regulator [Caulobacteraceae bacterium]|jgi:DNA-binding transcriptional MerR regulator|nr:MerR family transcriptional regulator [Caulobacteraceae bacterium]